MEKQTEANLGEENLGFNNNQGQFYQVDPLRLLGMETVSMVLKR